MNAVLFWKEYRQQRALWLAILVLAVLLGGSLVLFLGAARLEALNPSFVIFSLAAAYGVISGTMLLASEKEDGTLAFLDSLTGQRTGLWKSKLIAGAVLTVAQGLALAGLSLAFGLCSFETALWLPLVALDALAWGLLGGALCSSALTATLAAVPLLATSWVLVLVMPSVPAVFLVKVALGLAAASLSWRTFCREDLTRQVPRQVALPLARLPFHSPALALGWLIARQGRWVLLGGMATALLLGFTVDRAPVVLWPIGTLLLGLACGLAVFLPDQPSGTPFLAAQRMPSGRIWSWKIAIWSIALVGMLVVTWYLATAINWLLQPLPLLDGRRDLSFHLGEPTFWIERWFPGWGLWREQPHWMLLTLWPLYGFSVGQFFGLFARRAHHAAFLAVLMSVLLVSLWVPSLLVGGLPSWQPLIPAILLLLTTRLMIRPWIAGRLWTGRPLLGAVGMLTLLAAAVVACLWHRAVEVPDLGEPFDVQAFLASLPSPEQNEAGRLILAAATTLPSELEEAEREVGVPTDRPRRVSVAGPYQQWLQDALEQGWPEGENKLNQWLDRLFQKSWADQARRAAHLPLGLLVDPRRAASVEQSLNHSLQLFEIARLFVARALQRQARGDPRGALEELQTALRLARQVENRSPEMVFMQGELMEFEALLGFRHWLEKAGADPALLREALAILKAHAATAPDLRDVIKTQFILLSDGDRYRDAKFPLSAKLVLLACEAPWEHERQVRIRDAFYRGYLLRADLPPIDLPPGSDSETYYSRLAESLDLPPSEGPGAHLHAEQWGRFASESRLGNGHPNQSHFDTLNSERWLRLDELAIAAALYQSERGSPPPQLGDLVPTYLDAVPTDPANGRPFGYHVSRGEQSIPVPSIRRNQTVRIKPGQAYLEFGEKSRIRIPIPLPQK